MIFIKKTAESKETVTYEMDVFLIATLAVIGVISVIAIILLLLIPIWWIFLIVTGLILAFGILIVLIVIDVAPMYKSMIAGTISDASDLRPGVKQIVVKKFSEDVKARLRKNPR